jgi:hypothetical protein
MRISLGTVNRAQRAPEGSAGGQIRVGDRVRWNDRYTGTVSSVNGVSAVVVERWNEALGHKVTWRLDLRALKVVKDDDAQ